MAGTVATVVSAVGSVLHTACLPLALLCVVLRFRGSRGVERQQLRWVAAGAAVAVVGLLAGALAPQNLSISAFLYSLVLCIPLGIAVAVLRYRLWDLDRLISRTLTYTLVTALLERVSMRREGHLLESTWAKGEWTSELLYAVLRREWPAH